MRVLIVEDDQNKIRQIADFVGTSLTHATIIQKNSYQSGLREAIEQRPDVVILDMSMPTFDVSPTTQGGRMRPYAGREILRELSRKSIPAKVVVVTQFESFHEGGQVTTLEQLKEELHRSHPDNYIGTVYYNAAESRWRGELAAALATVIEQRYSTGES